jgi:protein involved in polysaccharide export with SLBB domain
MMFQSDFQVSFRSWPTHRGLRVAILGVCLVASLGALTSTQQAPQEAFPPFPVPAAQPVPWGQSTDAAAPAATASGGQDGSPADKREDEKLARLEREIRALKAKEKGPRRFAADLFAVPLETVAATEGGMSDDYVLGVGDRLLIMSYGGAGFETTVQVDGRGEVSLPKLGTVRVAGLALDRAKVAVEGLVRKTISTATISMKVTRLREVRVFILGEVYRPGGYLVPSLSSIVNLLSLSGGPTGIGSYRDVRILRSGKIVQVIDLYPLRAEGVGNLTVHLQNGDTIFVPLAHDTVVMEGAFRRVTSMDVETQDVTNWTQAPSWMAGDAQGADVSSSQGGKTKGTDGGKDAVGRPEPVEFEYLPQETAADMVHFAGGLSRQAYRGSITLRREDATGVFNALDIPVTETALRGTSLQRGDIFSAMIQRDRTERVVTLGGWVRVPGTFARNEGQRVSDLLLRERQMLPDTYLESAQVVRTLPNGSTRMLSFSPRKALASEQENNLLLQDRDVVTLFRVQDLRPDEKVQVLGPLRKAGSFAFYKGMRASDLLFMAGIPNKSANRLVAELARSQSGKPSRITKLDLQKLLSTEYSSPVELRDPLVNPELAADDTISVYEIPDFKPHRVVKISGQVAMPGSYVLDSDRPNLKELITRAGGFTSNAMPKAGIFIREISPSQPGLRTAPMDATGNNRALPQGKPNDSAAQGLQEILERLSETKRQPTTGQLLKSPIMHGLGSGVFNRMVVDFDAAVGGDANSDIEMRDGDEIIIPRKTDAAYVIGETASPFAAYRVDPGTTVRSLLARAGGTTRNADESHIRLVKANGQILDSWVYSKMVEPGDAILVPQKFRRDLSWQENLQAMTPLALILNAIRR